MGMSASQARFLSLTARKTNTEYEGQQINQQRTTLSNESANYYSQLASMTVPTPPSSSDYSKITYSFEDGTENNTITSLIAQPNGVYLLNYLQETVGETINANGNVIITRKDDGTYAIGATTLYNVGSGTTYYTWIDATTGETRRESSLPDPEPAEYSTEVTPEGERWDNDPYLKTLSNEDKADALALEQQYLRLLRNKYGEETNWFVRYQKDGNGSYYPVFYNQKEVEESNYTDNNMSTSGIKSYVYGQGTVTKDIRNKYARVEQDTSGRYTTIIIYNSQDDCENNIDGITYKLTAKTSADDAAYNDAMNKYFFDKAQYDKKIQEVNAKIEIIQVQDKNLELKLKQLDTEENALNTEMEAVKKVIQKNVDSSFKTFNA